VTSFDLVGLDQFQTTTKGIKSDFKKIFGDFVVEEVINNDLLCFAYPGKGNFSIYKVRAENWDNHHLIQSLSKLNSLSHNDVKCCGTKDKHAITTQYLSFKSRKEIIFPKEGIISEFVGYSNKALWLGAHMGNNFKINLSNIHTSNFLQKAQNTIDQINSQGGLVNFYGRQRFGNNLDTHLVGKELIQKKWDDAFRIYSKDMKVNAYTYFRRMNPLLKNMFISSYQSSIFNKEIAQKIKNNSLVGKLHIGSWVSKIDFEGNLIPRSIMVVDKNNIKTFERQKTMRVLCEVLPCYGNDVNEVLKSNKEFSSIITQEEIDILKQCSRKTYWRRIQTPVDVNISAKDNSLNLEFFLPKGQYATNLVREIRKNN